MSIEEREANYKRLMEKANNVDARIQELLKKKEEVKNKLDEAYAKGSSTSESGASGSAASQDSGTAENKPTEQTQ